MVTSSDNVLLFPGSFREWFCLEPAHFLFICSPIGHPCGIAGRDGINERHLSLSIRVGMLNGSHVWSNQFRGLRDCGCGNIDFFNLHRGPSVVGSRPDISGRNSGESPRLR